MKTSSPFFVLLVVIFTTMVACTVNPAQIPPTAAALQNVPWLNIATAVPAPTTELTDSKSATVVPEQTEATIVLPISIYIIDSEDESGSSARNEEDIREIFERVNNIWAQANIQLNLQTIERITLPQEIMADVMRGDFSPFFAAAEVQFEIPNPSLINGFYAQQIGGPNGIVPFNSPVFFVTDTPSVFDERVTSHEIGHILGLHHVLDDTDRLMFSGTNGMTLTSEEILVARYGAQGSLNRVR